MRFRILRAAPKLVQSRCCKRPMMSIEFLPLLGGRIRLNWYVHILYSPYGMRNWLTRCLSVALSRPLQLGCVSR